MLTHEQVALLAAKPLEDIKHEDWQSSDVCMHRLGLTPADLARVSIDPGKTDCVSPYSAINVHVMAVSDAKSGRDDTKLTNCEIAIREFQIIDDSDSLYFSCSSEFADTEISYNGDDEDNGLDQDEPDASDLLYQHSHGSVAASDSFDEDATISSMSSFGKVVAHAIDSGFASVQTSQTDLKELSGEVIPEPDLLSESETEAGSIDLLIQAKEMTKKARQAAVQDERSMKRFVQLVEDEVLKSTYPETWSLITRARQVRASLSSSDYVQESCDPDVGRVNFLISQSRRIRAEISRRGSKSAESSILPKEWTAEDLITASRKLRFGCRC